MFRRHKCRNIYSSQQVYVLISPIWGPSQDLVYRVLVTFEVYIRPFKERSYNAVGLNMGWSVQFEVKIHRIWKFPEWIKVGLRFRYSTTIKHRSEEMYQYDYFIESICTRVVPHLDHSTDPTFWLPPRMYGVSHWPRNVKWGIRGMDGVRSEVRSFIKYKRVLEVPSV